MDTIGAEKKSLKRTLFSDCHFAFYSNSAKAIQIIKLVSLKCHKIAIFRGFWKSPLRKMLHIEAFLRGLISTWFKHSHLISKKKQHNQIQLFDQLWIQSNLRFLKKLHYEKPIFSWWAKNQKLMRKHAFEDLTSKVILKSLVRS